MSMQIKPILSALRHHKAGTTLIALQIALTLAIVCNALFIIQQRVTMLSRPSGIDESHLLAIENQWIGSDLKHVGAQMATDLDILRRLPGVVDAFASNTYPLRNGGWSTGVSLKPDTPGQAAHTAIYFADDHALDTLGLKLVAGRNFRPSEISDMTSFDSLEPPEVIITQALAHKLFPDAGAVGKQIYVGKKPSTVVGVVAHLQVPWVGGWAANWYDNSVLVPFHFVTGGVYYLVRVRPGQMAAVSHAAPKALLAANRMRVIPDTRGVVPIPVARKVAYKQDRGMAILMGVICLVLLAITAAGIVGLTSFWVGQRRKQIGVRRALGATRRDILGYFLTENLLIGVTGVVLGAALAVGMNQWLMQSFEMNRLTWPWIAGGVLMLLLLGQAAVLAPALRASRVPPVVATRTV